MFGPGGARAAVHIEEVSGVRESVTHLEISLLFVLDIADFPEVVRDSAMPIKMANRGLLVPIEN